MPSAAATAIIADLDRLAGELVAERLTLAGLEVESIERRGRDVRGVRPHPTADKLSIVRLSAGGPASIVRICTGEVCERRMRPPSTKKVSCMSRAG